MVPFNTVFLFIKRGAVAERVGFEPTVAKGYTRSPGAPDSPLQHLSMVHYSGGEGGIRTHAPLSRRPLFESGTMNHSDTSPELKF
jgi:hypothetical protein